MTMIKNDHLFKELNRQLFPFWRHASHTFEACYRYLHAHYHKKKIPVDEETLLALINDSWKNVTICMLELLRDFYYEVFDEFYQLTQKDQSEFAIMFPLDLLEDLAGMKDKLEKTDIFLQAKERIKLNERLKNSRDFLTAYVQNSQQQEEE